MRPIFRPPLETISWRRKFKFESSVEPTKHHSSPPYLHNLHILNPQNHSHNSNFRFLHSLTQTLQNHPDNQLAIRVQHTLKIYRDSPTRKIELALDLCCSPTVTESLVLDVLKRHTCDWKPAFIFFNWVSKASQASIGSSFYNGILDILGKMRRFDELSQVLNEMSKRGLFDEETYRVLVNRYAAAHKVEEAMAVFDKRREFGIELDLVAFQKLLMYLCRYKHVEVAETLLYSKGNECGVDIKTMNIVLNGWCVLGNVHEAKRFWKNIIESKGKPDVFTYGTFIKALTKKGKLGTALKLYRAMWEEECNPDVVICNCVIDALCFKNRVPQALDVFKEMKERGCLPNAATYNSLIKHLCKIRRIEKVNELLDEMEGKGGDCMPDHVTFSFLLKAVKKSEEVAGILERMERNECKMNSDMYNLMLKLYMGWNCEEKVQSTWDEMEENGLGPDRRSYTIMIHWLCDKGRRIEDALHYFGQMKSKGMVPEPRTEVLVSAMNSKLKEKEVVRGEKCTANNDKSPRHVHQRKRKINLGKSFFY